jgi:hypothetical protein
MNKILTQIIMIVRAFIAALRGLSAPAPVPDPLAPGTVDVPPTTDEPTPKIVWSDGDRIGHFRVSHLEQRRGEGPISYINPAVNRVFVVGKFDNMGAVIIGIRTGSESVVKTKAFEAMDSAAFNKTWYIEFKLYDYTSTVSGQTLDIEVMQGYRRRDPATGVTSIVWTESHTHTYPIQRS